MVVAGQHKEARCFFWICPTHADLLIGEPTRRLVTRNSIFNIDEETMLVLATAHFKNRLERTYTGPITPDLFLKEGDDFDDLSKDQKVIQAVKWLKKPTKNVSL